MKTLKLVLKFTDCTEFSQNDRALFCERPSHVVLNHWRDIKQNTKYGLSLCSIWDTIRYCKKILDSEQCCWQTRNTLLTRISQPFKDGMSSLLYSTTMCCTASPLSFLSPGNEWLLYKVPTPHLLDVGQPQLHCHHAQIQHTTYLCGTWQRCLIKLNIVFYLHITLRGGFGSTNPKLFLILKTEESKVKYFI